MCLDHGGRGAHARHSVLFLTLYLESVPILAHAQSQHKKAVQWCFALQTEFHSNKPTHHPVRATSTNFDERSCCRSNSALVRRSRNPPLVTPNIFKYDLGGGVAGGGWGFGDRDARKVYIPEGRDVGGLEGWSFTLLERSQEEAYNR